MHSARTRKPGRLAIFGLGCLAAGLVVAPQPAALEKSPKASKARVLELYARLPLSFEANQGQADGSVKFLSRGPGYTLFLTPAEAVLSFFPPQRPQSTQRTPSSSFSAPPASSAVSLRMKLVGANPSAKITPLDELPGKSNYFLGNDPAQWRTNVPNYARVRYESVYPGIDLVFYGNQGQLEFDFVVAPGADPGNIRLLLDGADRLELDDQGDLVLQVHRGDLRVRQPMVYQELNGVRHPMAARYILYQPNRRPKIATGRSKGSRSFRQSESPRGEIRDPKYPTGLVGFEVTAYDPSKPLIIDPALSFSTYLGGSSGDGGNAIAVDSFGYVYVTGFTTSSNFPLVNPTQPTYISAYAGYMAFVVKMHPTGSFPVYSTFLGGSGENWAGGIAVDSTGNAYVTGYTNATDFPTANPLQAAYGGGLYDAFLAKLNASGSALVYSTYLGGTGPDYAYGIAIDSSGKAYITGQTFSLNFPTANPLQAQIGGGCFKTSNAGNNWNSTNVGLTATAVSALAIDPVNPSTVYAGGKGGIFRSTNGGSNWSAINSGLPNDVEVLALAIDPGTTSTLYAGSGSGVYKSTNAGSSWSASTSGLGATPVYVLAIDPSNSSILYAGTSVGVYKTANGAASWVAMSSGLPLNTQVNALAIDPSNSLTVYAGSKGPFVASASGFFKSTNGGSSWSASTSGLPPITGVAALVIDPSNPSTVYAGGAGITSNVFKSTDGGANWSASGTGLSISFDVTSLRIDPSSPSVLYAGTMGVFKTINGGGNWNATALPATEIQALAIDSQTPSTLYAGTLRGDDAFVTKLNVAGSALVYSTYLGGSRVDGARGIAVDSSGNAYVTGGTSSMDFPTANPVQAASAGGDDVFVAKLNAAGSALIYSTYLGGYSSEEARGIAVDTSGNAYVTGFTPSLNFPTVNPLPAGCGGAYVTKLNTAGSVLVYSTCLGAGSFGRSVAVDASGSAYVTGYTNSVTFPTANPLQPTLAGSSDLFVTKLSAAGSINYSTYLGGQGADEAYAIAVDLSGNVYVTGRTPGLDFPLTEGAFQTVTAFGDAFIAKIAETAGPCSYSIRPTLVAFFASGGGGGTVSVIAPSGCGWTAVSNDSWISISSGGSGTGVGAVEYSVPVNTTGSPRTGTITIAGQTFTVLQPSAGSGCPYPLSLSSGSATHGPGAESGSVSVIFEPAGCPWSAERSHNWITINSGSSGFGDGTVSYSLAANPSWTTRTGTLIIGGRDLRITQQGAGGSPSPVTTLAASSISAGTATLNGSVNPNGLATTAWFEWGTEPALAAFNMTPDQSISPGFATVLISAPLAALRPSTAYYFRAAASSSAGTNKGNILSFRTRVPTQVIITKNSPLKHNENP